MFFRKNFLFIFLFLIITHIIVHIYTYNKYMNDNQISFKNTIVAEINYNDFYKQNNEKVIDNLKSLCFKTNVRAVFNNENRKIIIKIIYGDMDYFLKEILKEYKSVFKINAENNTITLQNKDIFSQKNIQKEIIKTLKFRLKKEKYSIKSENNKLTISIINKDKITKEFLNKLFEKSYLSVHFGFDNDINSNFIDTEDYNKIIYKINKNEIFNYTDIKKSWIDFSTKRAILKVKFKNSKIIKEFTRQNQGKIVSFLMNNKVIFQTKINTTIFNGTFQEIIQNYDYARKLLNILQKKPLSNDVKIISHKINFIENTEYLNVCKFLSILFIFITIEILIFIYYNKLGKIK